ncbi:MAG: DUF2029 domain-containing protein [Anaerolineae bacterium]|nr:DUF2029 domain-containing protein [Anaerolineae bacterium]
MESSTKTVTTLNSERETAQGRISTLAKLRHDRLFWLTAALLAILLAFVVLFPLRAAGDIALYADIGGRVLDGQRPYIDFFEINTPMIYLLNVLPVAFSRLTGIHPLIVFHLFIWLIVAGTALSIGHISTRACREKRLGNISPWLMPMLLVFTSFAAWMLIAFGQRDHIFMLVFPAWGILRWYRWEGGQPPAWLAVLIGVLAAVGATLKPTFVLGVGLVEIYGLLRYRRWRAYFTWEILGAGIIVGAYGLYFAAQPEVLHAYLTEITPNIVAGYRSYGYIPATELIFGVTQSIVALILILIIALLGLRQGKGSGRFFVLLALMGLAGLLSYALQTKGWRYHSLPLLSSTFVIGGLLVERVFALPGLRALLRRHRIAGVAPVMIIILCVVWGIVTAPQAIYGEASEAGLQSFRNYAQPGDSAISADMEVIPFHPLVLQSGLKPVGRYPAAYPLAFAYADGEEIPDEVYDPAHTPPPLAQAYLDTFMHDIRVQQPQLIVLRALPCSVCIDVARYVKVHTDIEALLVREYDSLGLIAPYEVYVRKAA